MQTSMPDAFEEEVTKFDLGFTSVLISLLDKISQVILIVDFSKDGDDNTKRVVLYGFLSIPISNLILLSLFSLLVKTTTRRY